MDVVPLTQRRYGFACIQCRRKKIKCGGEKPSCRKCSKSGYRCTYKVADDSHVVLKGELSRNQARIRELEDGVRALALADDITRERLVRELLSNAGDPTKHQRSGLENLAESADGETSDDQTIDVVGVKQAEMTVNVDGDLQFFGATSRFHTESRHCENDHSLPAADRGFHSRWLASNARFQKSWEQMAFANLHRDTDVDPLTSSTLLRIYWTWQAPLHNCVYRQCFFRDMAMQGPYFSPFLLNVIYAHASRHIPDNDPLYSQVGTGDVFLKRARLLLLAELDEERPRIPTIQGLLILGGRQCAVGKTSEGWLYTGMAIRMIKDLGLHLNSGRNSAAKDLEPDDLEARKRLFLSAYSWDKSISLCLGRPPSLTEIPYSPRNLLDDGGDLEPWSPFYLGETEATYTPTACLTTLTFIHFCELSRIINDCYNTIYSGKTNSIKMQTILSIEQKLHSFYEQLPTALRIHDAQELQVCPPPHIFCLNILFHTLLILIYRPFYSTRNDHALSVRAREVCLERAKRVNSFFKLYGQTFNFRNQTYLISYCVYTAATVELQQLQRASRSASHAAAERLATTMSMLESEVRQTPGMRRSIDIIKTRLQEWESSIQRKSQTDARSDATGASASQLPTPELSLIGGSVINGGNPRQFDTMPSDLMHANALEDASMPLASGLASDLGIGHHQYDLNQTVEMNMDDFALVDWHAYDASGGFAPDTANWTWYDTTMLPNSF